MLIENADGKLIFSPSTSPENVFIYNGKRCSVAETTTMTMAIVRETLGEPGRLLPDSGHRPRPGQGSPRRFGAPAPV